MATRESLYRSFGPQLMEAVVKLMLQEVNVLRVNAGLAERTSQQLLDGLASKLADTDKYDWMSNEP